MSDIVEGFWLMIKGMAFVFGFLLILMFFMKFVPILSNLKKPSLSHRNSVKNNPNLKNINTNPNPGEKVTYPAHNDNDNDNDNNNPNEIPEMVVAAVAAAIFMHTGKKPMQIAITAPKHAYEHYNVWGIAGRQDIMDSRDMTGQAGFQY